MKAPSGSRDTFGALAVKNADRKVGGQWPRDRTQQSDRHQLCGDDPADAEGVGKIYDPTFNGMFSEPAMIALDAGRTFNGGKPPAELTFGDISIPNPRKDSPPRTILGSRQKQWFMDQLSEHDTGTLDSFLSLTPRVTLSGRPK